MRLSPNIYHLFIRETSNFPLGSCWGVQSVIVVNLKARDWHGCSGLLSSKNTDHERESSYKRNGDFKYGTECHPAPAGMSQGMPQDTQDD